MRTYIQCCSQTVPLYIEQINLNCCNYLILRMTEEPEKVRSAWARALEIIKNTRLRSSSLSKKQKSEENSADENSNEEEDEERFDRSLFQSTYQMSELSFPPRQAVIAKLTNLITKMHHPIEGLNTFEQDFSDVDTSASCRESCTMDSDDFDLNADGAFSTIDLVEWLEDHLEIESATEACHVATMLCRMGFIFPCDTAWDLCTLKLDKSDELIWRFQCPHYWPAETHIASESDHVRHLLRRQANCYGIPFEEHEQEYLTLLEVVFSSKWEFLKKTAGLQNGTSESYYFLPQMFIASWQDYAYWKINRPPCYTECLGSTNPYEWALSLRGLNRNFPYMFLEDKTSNDGMCQEEHPEDEDQSANNDMKNSCNRIITFSKKIEEIDPLVNEEQCVLNPWTNELVSLSDEPLNPRRSRSWELSFDLLMKDGFGRKLFEQHVNHEFSGENFDFYSKCIQLRTAPLSNVDELAEEIFQEFISRDGLTPVNINEDTISLVSNEMDEGRLRYAFDSALYEIYNLMKKDSYRRFLASSVFQKEEDSASDE